MGKYSLYTDFENYVKENQLLINFLEKEQSLLNDYVSPIIKTMTYIMKQTADIVESNLLDIFNFGFNLLFENIEQLKLYLRQLNNDYKLFDKMSLYIKIIFDLEELKVELIKDTENDYENDIKSIDKTLDFFEEIIIPNISLNEFELDKYLNLYYEFLGKYSEINLMVDVFSEYCGTYGI